MARNNLPCSERQNRCVWDQVHTRNWLRAIYIPLLQYTGETGQRIGPCSDADTVFAGAHAARAMFTDLHTQGFCLHSRCQSNCELKMSQAAAETHSTPKNWCRYGVTVTPDRCNRLASRPAALTITQRPFPAQTLSAGVTLLPPALAVVGRLARLVFCVTLCDT